MCGEEGRTVEVSLIETKSVLEEFATAFMLSQILRKDSRYGIDVFMNCLCWQS